MPTVIYHANCPDGFCAAWLFSKVFKNVRFVPANYGDAPPELRNDEDVYIVDFSYPGVTLLDLAERANRVVVLDHHKTAELALRDLVHPNLEIIFDMERSGARLAWEWLCENVHPPSRRVPFLVDYVEDRDLWRHELDCTAEVNAAIRSYPQEFGKWDGMHLCGLDALINEGKSILRYRRQRIEEMKALARPGKILGHSVPVVNCSIKDIQSEVAGELADPFAACFYQMADGRFSYSLRSRDDFDVSALAKQFGGGGHKNAAGFKVPRVVHE